MWPGLTQVSNSMSLLRSWSRFCGSSYKDFAPTELFPTWQPQLPDARIAELMLTHMRGRGKAALQVYTSIIALITPVSGLVQSGNSVTTSLKGARCVIQGDVSIRFPSIREMIRLKSAGRAFLLAKIVSSRR